MKKQSSRGGQQGRDNYGANCMGDAATPKKKSWFSRIRRGLWTGEEGNALVELAFVAPIMMLMLTGLASFAMALYSYQQLGYAVASAAQQVGDEQGLITDPCATLETDVTTALPSWTVSKFTYSATITDSGGTAHSFGPTAGSSFSCTAGASDMAQNEPMTVTVSYQYSWFNIFTWRPDNEFVASGNLQVSEAVLVE